MAREIFRPRLDGLVIGMVIGTAVFFPFPFFKKKFEYENKCSKSTQKKNVKPRIVN